MSLKEKQKQIEITQVGNVPGDGPRAGSQGFAGKLYPLGMGFPAQQFIAHNFDELIEIMRRYFDMAEMKK